MTLLMLLTACRVIASAVRAAATAGQQPVQEQNPLAALLAGPHSLPAMGSNGSAGAGNGVTDVQRQQEQQGGRTQQQEQQQGDELTQQQERQGDELTRQQEQRPRRTGAEQNRLEMSLQSVSLRMHCT